MEKTAEIRPAARTEGITYAVRDVVVLAEEVAKTGKSMLYLNIGDPNQFDFETPEAIVQATFEAMKANRTGYAPSSGIKEARDAIEREAERRGIRNIHDVFVTTGGSEAIDVCLTALVEPGENVLIPAPRYPLYTAILAKLGARENPYYLDEARGWQPDLEDLASRVDEKTRAIVIINPNNPTGAVYSREVLEGIAALAREHDLVVFSDEIYDKLILDEDRTHVSIASLDPELPVVTFNGLSKSYLVPGFRIGWGVVSGDGKRLRPYIEAMNKLLRARLCANHPEQYAIRPALEGDQGHIEDMKARLRRRRDIVFEGLNAIPGISCTRPTGAFYAFPRLEIDQPDGAFVKDLIRETGVVVVPGSGFGQVPGTRHFRVVFLPPEEVLRRAIDLIRGFMASR